jgi:hypothetical protein
VYEKSNSCSMERLVADISHVAWFVNEKLVVLGL